MKFKKNNKEKITKTKDTKKYVAIVNDNEDYYPGKTTLQMTESELKKNLKDGTLSAGDTVYEVSKVYKIEADLKLV